MSKKTYYFPHDYNARNDPKLQKVLINLGQEGKGIYWDLIEMLYEQDGYLELSELQTYAVQLRTNYDCITNVVREFKLFEFDDEKFWSISVLRRLEIQKEKSRKARESVMVRYSDTNVVRPCYDRSTIKESKVKEIKEKKVNKIKEIVFPFSSEKFLDKWNLWVDFKKEQFNFTYKSAISTQASLNELVKLSNGHEEIAIKIIEQSINKGWKGFFELKNENNGNTTSQSRVSPKITTEQLHEAHTKFFSERR